jgi:hypothetical protein
MEFNVDHGDAGGPGVHGQPGSGGAGGIAGEGGSGGQYYEQRGDGQTQLKQARNGQRGKAGKKGKSGKPAPSKSSKGGSPGLPGKISFCIYDESGLKESGGTPFRIVLNKKDLPKLNPVPYNFGTACVEDFFVFGQALQLGPLLPINIGSISSPLIKMLGSVTLTSSSATEHGAIGFPSIPGENKTRYGELPQSSAGTLTLKIPKFSHAKFHLHGNVWPWASTWSSAPATTAKFNTIFNIDGILQKASKVDGDHASTRQFEIPIDVPIEIVQQESMKGIKVPNSVMLIGDKSSVDVVVMIRNKLKGTAIAADVGKLQLCVAGFNFKASVSAQFANKITLLEAPPDAANNTGYLIVAAQVPIESIPANSLQSLTFSIKLPPGGNQLGSNMYVKADLYYDGVLSQFSPAQLVRIGAPWPVEGTPSAQDVIFFCDSTFKTEDYGALSTLAFSMKLRAVFLDYQHLSEQNNGRLPIDVWAHHVGKGVVVWIPSTAALASIVPNEDLVQHLRAGGGLVVGEKSTFALPPEFAHVGSVPGRRAICLGSEFGLARLREGLAIDEKRVAGPSIVTLAVAIVTAQSIERRLELLLDMTLAGLLVGDQTLDNYQVVVESGCCGCGSNAKVFPAIRTPVTFRDILIAAIRTDIQAELTVFGQTSNVNFVTTIPIIRKFVASNVLNKPPSAAVGSWARDIHAIIFSAELLDESRFTAQQKSIWISIYHQAKVDALQLENLAASSHMQSMVADQRALDCDVLLGFTRRSQTVDGKIGVNVGKGNKLVMMNR